MSSILYIEAITEGEIVRIRIGREWVEPPRRFAWLWRLLRRVRDWGRFREPFYRWIMNKRGRIEFRHGDLEAIVIGDLRLRFDVLRLDGPDFDPALVENRPHVALVRETPGPHGGAA